MGKNTNWQNLIDNASDKKTKRILTEIVEEFFTPDKINPIKFKANYEILKHNSRGIYKSSTLLTSEPDLSDEGTGSIDSLAGEIDRPLGYYDWFIAAYPDVVIWFQDIGDAKMMEMLENPAEDVILNEEHKIKNKYLRKIVDGYSKKLECAS